MNYLDKTGLTHLWDKIKAYVDNAVAGLSVPTDYIVEEGTSGLWRYKKFASGEAECYMPEFYTYSNLTMTATGNLYMSEARYLNLPSGLFVDSNYIVDHEIQSSSGPISIVRQSTSTKEKMYFKIYKVYSTSTGVDIKFSVKGRWK